jgi:two-component system, NtrC family, response regulator AtoC
MSQPLVLIIEDDETISLSLKTFFETRGYMLMTALTGAEGLSVALREIPDTIILDLRLPDIYGLDILKEIKKSCPDISVILMTGYGELKEAVEAMKFGAEYYFQKPIDLDELAVMVEKSIGIRQIRQEVKLNRVGHHPIIGRSKQFQGLIHMINLLAANSLTTVLIQGETGTGKELVARNIHALSSRHDKPFVEVNCAAIPDHIVESELFGYEAGAFTDARKTKKGLFELADMGTLFLDEIGDMPMNVQAKLLRVLESRTIRRLGGTRDISLDVRIITAGNKDLMQLVKAGHFREDLFYRLNVMPLSVAPLRERPEDIPLIADFLLEAIKVSVGKKNVGSFTSQTVDLLCSYAWPGNVRELRNVVERAVLLCPGGDITDEHLSLPSCRDDSARKNLTLEEVERSHIEHILKMAGGNRTRAASILGLARSTLNVKIKQFNIN